MTLFLYGDIKTDEHQEKVDCISELSYYVAEYDAVLNDKGFIENGSVITNAAVVVYGEPLKVAKTETQLVSVQPTQPQPVAQQPVAPSRGGLPREVTDTLTHPTGLTASEFDSVISTAIGSNSDSKLQGLGATCVNFETKYNLNALYALGISIYESGYGTSDAAQNKNNLVGAMNGDGNLKSYDSPDECIMDLGRFLSEKYVSRGHTSISSIAPHYCPPNSNNWHAKVSYITDELISISNNLPTTN